MLPFLLYFVRVEHGFYDTLGNPESVENINPTTGHTQTVSYDYDDVGNREWIETSINNGSGDVVQTHVDYGYDNLNRITSVTDAIGTPQETTFEYNTLGQLTLIERPNDVDTFYTYGDVNASRNPSDPTETHSQNPYQVYTIEHKDTESTPVTIGRYDYSYDLIGNTGAMAVTTYGGSVTNISYDYDRAYRLTEESYVLLGGATSGNEYQYDRAGNRTRMINDDGTTAYHYNPNDELTRVDLPDYTFEAYEYDARGNLTSVQLNQAGVVATPIGSPTLYTYNARDQLINADVQGFVEVDYNYDFTGNRVQQSIGGATTNYLWDEFSYFGDVVLETGVNPDTTLYRTMDYTLAGGMLISQTDSSDLTQYFLSDTQGSTRILANSDGSVAAEFSYDAFGNVNETIDPADSDTTYLYTGQQYDPYTELYSLRARYYNPLSGRFMSRDTWAYNYQDPTELNRYVYTSNNPATYVDPSGYAEEYVIPIIGVAVPAVVAYTFVGIGLVAIFGILTCGVIFGCFEGISNSMVNSANNAINNAKNNWSDVSDLLSLGRRAFIEGMKALFKKETFDTIKDAIVDFITEFIANQSSDTIDILHYDWVERQTDIGNQRVRELDPEEVHERGLERPKANAGYGAADSIWEDEVGDLYLGGQEGELTSWDPDVRNSDRREEEIYVSDEQSAFEDALWEDNYEDEYDDDDPYSDYDDFDDPYDVDPNDPFWTSGS